MEVRPNYIDYAKVITMFLVIYGHYLPFLGLKMSDNTISHSVYIITLFHMPVFFYISGLLFKSIPFKQLIKKTWQTLITPYILIGIISIVIGFACHLTEISFSFKALLLQIIFMCSGGDFLAPMSFSEPLWFCYALVLIKLFHNIDSITIKWVILGLGIGVMYIGDKLPFRIDSALVGYIFFSMGYYSKRICKKVFSQNSSWLILTSILGLLLILLTVLIDNDIHDATFFSINSVKFGKYPLLFIIGAVGGIMLIFSISQVLSFYKIKKIQELSNGMIITLGFHQLLFLMIKKVVFPSYNIWLAIIISVIVYVICYIFIRTSARYFPALLGNRRLQ